MPRQVFEKCFHEDAESKLAVPYRAERNDRNLPCLWHLTIKRAIYWFEVERDRETVRILAGSCGGHDPVWHVLVRLINT